MHLGHASRLETTFVQFGDAQAPSLIIDLMDVSAINNDSGGAGIVFLRNLIWGLHSEF